MSRRHIGRIGRPALIVAILLLTLPLLGCSDDDDDGPTGPELPEGIYFNAANGHYYQPVAGAFTWTEARDAAAAATYEELTGHLAVVDSEQENLFLYNDLGTDVQRYYLGGFQDTESPDYAEPAGGWCWCSGGEFTYAAWAPNEPNNGGGENYLAFIWGEQPIWNDVPGNWDMNAGYIIEFE
jgi:hypothetical protein